MEACTGLLCLAQGKTKSMKVIMDYIDILQIYISVQAHSDETKNHLGILLNRFKELSEMYETYIAGVEFDFSLGIPKVIQN